MEVKSLMLVIFQCPYAFLGLSLFIFIFYWKKTKNLVVGARLPRKEIFSTIFFKLKCQWAFVWNFRMWQEHAGGGVTPSENVRGRGMKDWEYLEMRLGGLTTMWSLDHIYIWDLLTFEKWRPVPPTWGWLAFMGSIKPSLLPTTIYHTSKLSPIHFLN